MNVKKQIYHGVHIYHSLAHFSVILLASLRKLKADISVITERLESSIKIAGEPYYSEIHNLLADKLDLKNWHDGIDRKLAYR